MSEDYGHLDLSGLGGVQRDSLPVDSFTFDDFCTPAPYEWLYSFIDDGFQTQIYYNMMSARAKKVKYPQFGKAWKQFLAAKQGGIRKTEMVEGKTEFDGQPQELNCGDFICTDGGIIGNTGFSETEICSHPLTIKTRLVNLDSDTQKIELYYRHPDGDESGWKSLIIDREVMCSAQKLAAAVSCKGVGIDSENARLAVRYLSYIDQRNYGIIPVKQSIGRFGWIDRGRFSPYVDDLDFDGEGNFGQMFKSVKNHGTFGKWLDVAKQGRRHNVITRIILAASFASVLVKPLGALSNFLHLWGGTGSGKTVGLMLAASVYADPVVGTYIKNLNSTQVGQEMLAGFLNSLPLCLDELQSIKNSADGYDQLIYRLCESSGKTRGDKSGGIQRTATWNLMILTTGEQPITGSTSGGGAENRVINVDMGESSTFPRDELHNAAEAMKENYGHAGRLFVERLMEAAEADDGTKTYPNQDRAKEIMEEYMERFRLLPNEKRPSEKQILTASVILTADKLAEEWIFDDGLVLGVDDIVDHLTTADQTDVNMRCYEWLCGYIATNNARFYDDNDNKGEVWGDIDEEKNKCYFLTVPFDRALDAAGFNSRAFLSWAARTGKIDKSPDGRNKVKHRFRRGSTWAVSINLMDDTETDSTETDNNGFVKVDEGDEMPF